MAPLNGLPTTLVVLLALLVVAIQAHFNINRKTDCAQEDGPCNLHGECCDPTFCYGMPGDKRCKTPTEEEYKQLEEAFRKAFPKRCKEMGRKCLDDEDCCVPFYCHSNSGLEKDLKCKKKEWSFNKLAVSTDRYWIVVKEIPPKDDCFHEGTRCNHAGSWCCDGLKCEYYSTHKYQCVKK